MCAPRRFAFMVTHPAQLSSRVNYERNLSLRVSGLARRRVRCERQDRQSTAIRTGPRPRTDRRDDDRYRLDDRVGHLYYLSGIVAIERRTRLAAACVG